MKRIHLIILSETKNHSQYGMSLVAAIVITTLFTSLVSIMATYQWANSRMTAIVAGEQKAYYLSESGTEYALKSLKDSANWRAGVTNVVLGDGKFTITIEDSTTIPALSDSLLVSSVAEAGVTAKKIQVLCLVSDVDFKYSAYAGDEIDFTTGKGIINGDLHANNSATLGWKYTHNGNLTQGTTINPPTINWAHWASEATAAGQHITGDYTFNSAGSPYTGVWYVTGDADIGSNGVQINGTLVVDGDFDINKNNCQITATPATNPALLVGKTATVHKNNTQISGFIYCGEDLDFDKNNPVINGAISVQGSIINSGNNLVINHDPSYLRNLSGVSFPVEVQGDLEVFNWKHLY